MKTIRQLIKTRLTILAAVLCSFFVTTAVLAQSPQVYVWTNQYVAQLGGSSSGDLNQATNWNPNGVPNPMTPTPDANGFYGDLMQFAGQTTGAITATENGGSLSGGGGQSYPAGARIQLTSSQMSPVTLISVVSISGGLRMNYFDVDAGSGGLTLGDHSGNCLDIVGGEENGQIFGFTNNTSTPFVINETVRWRMGGAGSHPFAFSGTGNYTINNHMRSANSSAVQVEMEGSGIMTWTGTNCANAGFPDQLGTPVRVDNGTMIIKSSDLLNAGAGNPSIVNNGTLLEFDWSPAPGSITTPDSVQGSISGAGPIQVNNGSVTFAGASTFSGNINLTGGELIAGSVENVGVNGPLGEGGIISFNGGTLGWNLVNAFDYSSRFSTAANQMYNLDTGGSSPTLVTGLTSSGGSLNKIGGGTLTLAGANTYSGSTTVSGGELLFQGTKTPGGTITVADGADLGVVENGSQISPNTLTLGTSTGVVLEFNNVTNTTAATLTPGTVVANAPVTILVNSGQFFSIGETFPLLKWTTGTPPAVTLGFLAGAGGHLVTNINNVEIDLVIDNPPYIWTGDQDDIWNTTSVDWVRSGIPVSWVNGNYALLDDTGTQPNVTLSGSIAPTNTTVNNSLLTYAIANSAGNTIHGPGSLTKNGSGTLTLPGGANDYTGITTISGGTLAASVLANGGSASDIGAATSGNTNIVLNGGTLQYTGPGATIDRLFSVGQNGGTIDNEGTAALVFGNSGLVGMSGNGPRTLTLTNNDSFGDTLACGISNHPAGTSLAMNGTGTWILTGTNGYANGTVVNSGILQVGATGGGASGTLGGGNISIGSGAEIDFQRTGTLTVPGAISGAGSVSLDGSGTIVLANNNSFTGGANINAGTLQLGTGGGSGSLNFAEAIADNSLLIFDTSGTFNYGAPGAISGGGNVIVEGGGFIKSIGANTYSGWTLIGANTLFQPLEGQDGGLASSVVTNNGILRLVRQDATITYNGPIVGTGKLQIGANNVNVGVITLTGSNSYTGGTFIGDNQLTLGDGSTPGAGAITGNVVFTNNFTIAQDNTRTLDFNRADNFTFSGTITTNFASPQVNLGILQMDGPATVTLTGNNTYGSGTIVNSGTLQIGNGGASGSVGTGPVTINNGNNGVPLVINRTGTLAIPGQMSGGFNLQAQGGVTLILGGANTFSGTTVISNASEFINGGDESSSIYVTNGIFGGIGGVSGPVTLDTGTTLYASSQAPQPGTIGNLIISNNLTLGGHNFVFEVNRAASPANSMVTVMGTLTSSGPGSLVITNVGPNLHVGDRFVLFNQPLPNGAQIAVSGGRATWTNGLAVDGSVGVASVAPLPSLNVNNLGNGKLQFSWSDPYDVFVLQDQTNSRATGLQPSMWFNYPNGTNGVTVPLVATNPTVFFRIISQP